MRSVKNLVISVLALVLLLLVLTVGYNHFVVSEMNAELRAMGRRIDQLETDYVASNLPLRVLDNLAAQRTGLDPADEERLASLSAAYGRNVASLTTQLLTMRTTLDHLSDDVVTTSLRFFGDYRGELDGLAQDTRQLKASIVALERRVAEVYPENYLHLTAQAGILKEQHAGIESEILALGTRFKTIDAGTQRDYISIVNGLFYFLFFLLAGLSILLVKFMRIDFRFVMRGFHMLADQDFNRDHLPKITPVFKEETEVVDLVHSILEERRLVTRIKEIAARGYLMDEVMEDLFHSIRTTLPVDRIGIAFVDHDQKKIMAEHGVSNYGEILLGPGFSVQFEETGLTTFIDSKKAFISQDLMASLEKKPDSRSLRLITDEGIRSNIVVPLVMEVTTFGFLFFSSREADAFDREDLRIAEKVAYELAPLLDKSYLAKTIFSKITNTFAELVDKKDNETGGHILRMVRYSVAIAEGLRNHERESYRVDSNFIKNLERHASVHDIGKVAIPDHILKKPGKLDPEEWEIMKTHAPEGADIFTALREGLKGFNPNFYRMAEEITRHHHERWDGSGYPDGLSGEAIPLCARIVAISDVFDALTSERVYKPAYSFDRSIQIIQESRGSHLDPVLVDVFLEQKENIRAIYCENR